MESSVLPGCYRELHTLSELRKEFRRGWTVPKLSTWSWVAKMPAVATKAGQYSVRIAFKCLLVCLDF
jgi:hypothetical protein